MLKLAIGETQISIRKWVLLLSIQSPAHFQTHCPISYTFSGDIFHKYLTLNHLILAFALNKDWGNVNLFSEDGHSPSPRTAA